MPAAPGAHATMVGGRPRADRLRRRTPARAIRRRPRGSARAGGDHAPALHAAEWRRAALRWADGAWAKGGDRPGMDDRGRRPDTASAGRRPAARWACFRSTRRPGAGSTAPSARSAGRSAARPRSCRCSATRAARRLACARAGARVAHVDASKPAVAWARRNASSSGPGRAARSAGSSTTCEPSSGASGAAAARTTASILDPPTYGHGRAPGRSTSDLPAARSTTSPRSSARAGARAAQRPHARLRRRAARRARVASTSASPGRPASSHLDRAPAATLRLGAWARARAG